MSARKVSVLVVLLVVAGAWWGFDLGGYLDLATLKAQQASIVAYAAESPLTAAVLYFAVYVLTTAVSLPGATLLTLAGGALFGLGWGTLIVSFASSLGATLAFLASRFVLRDWLARRYAAPLAAIDAGVVREGAFYLFSLRLVPLFPFFAINALFGLTAMKTRTFYAVSQLGMLAATLVYVNAGTQLARLESLAGIVSPALLASFAALGLLPLAARRIVGIVRIARRRHVYRGWQKPRRFDRNLIVIGGGSAGLVAAYVAAALKARVTLVEKSRLGGDCLNTGCVPSKALIRSARLLAQIARARDFGLDAASAQFDFARVMQRVRAVVAAVEPHDSAERYTQLGVDVVAGTATIVTPWAVEIKGADGTRRTLTARAIVIACGARPLVPEIPGLDEVGYLTSETLWELNELPQRLLVLGGGAIGCELAQAFARFGARVTLIEAAPHILPREDEDVAQCVTRRLLDEGVEVLAGHLARRFFVADGEKRALVAPAAGGGELTIAFDALLVAVGRGARLTGYGLETLGVSVGRTVVSNEFLQTNYPNIYAAGDVAGPYQLTHAAGYQAGVAALNALLSPFWRFRADYAALPAAVFVDPQVARVGINEQEASERGVACETTRYPLADLDRAIADGATEGFVKVLTPPGSDRILGVTIVGENAAELIAEYALAMRQRLGLNAILGSVHAYPTYAEANRYAAGVWKRAHAPARLLAWAERWHAWRRGGWQRR